MYTFHSRVRYSELNHKNGHLDLYSIINYFQDCSTFQSEDNGRGLEYLQSQHKVWMLNSWQVDLIQPAKLGDYITVSTWAHNFKGFYGYRNFMMKNKDDQVIAVANSIWLYLDTLSGRPTKVPEDHGYPIEDPYPMVYADRKISIGEAQEILPPFPVIKSNIDSYNHVNNGQYIKMAEEYLPVDFKTKHMRVEYKKQAILGDMIVPIICKDHHKQTIILADLDQKPYAIIEFIA